MWRVEVETMTQDETIVTTLFGWKEYAKFDQKVTMAMGWTINTVYRDLHYAFDAVDDKKD